MPYTDDDTESHFGWDEDEDDKRDEDTTDATDVENE